MSQFLLDTSPIVAHLRQKIDLASALPTDAVLLTSLITLGELEKGIRRVNDSAAERAKVEKALEHIAVLKPDEGTARHYGRIATDLEMAGKRIPENDMWIAAFAAEYKLELVTGDEHFTRVDEITVRQLTW